MSQLHCPYSSAYPSYFQKFFPYVTWGQDSLKMDMFDLEFSHLNNATYVTSTKEIFSLAGFNVIIKRSPTPYYINVYIPTALLTMCSFIGFLFPIDSEEGRRTAWLVTIFLMLVNISSTERNRGPSVRNPLPFNKIVIENFLRFCSIL